MKVERRKIANLLSFDVKNAKNLTFHNGEGRAGSCLKYSFRNVFSLIHRPIPPVQGKETKSQNLFLGLPIWLYHPSRWLPDDLGVFCDESTAQEYLGNRALYLPAFKG